MKREQYLSRRVIILIAVMGIWGAVIAWRLYRLQVVHSADFRGKADHQQQQVLDVAAPRGIIYDRNLKELAASVNVKSVFVVPHEIEDHDGTVRILTSLTGLPAPDLARKLSSDRSFVWIHRKISASEASAIENARLPGVHFVDEPKRFYPDTLMAAQVLGYVDLDEQGLGGLEYRYNDDVRGESGKVVYRKDANGKSFDQSSIEQPPQPGANLITTIDKNIQYIVEKALQDAVVRTRAKAISIITMDPHTGEILAMANYPTFDPNEHLKYPPSSWVNGAISHTYEPGSTFKILTVGAALEEKLTTTDERIDCQMGSIVLVKHVIHDHKPFGVLSVSEILQKSSDVGAIKLGLRLGNDRMSSYIRRFGFGQPTGIDLPGEEKGLTKPAAQWSGISIGAISMGQEVGVTPLQIVRMVSAIANGGILYRPYVVREVRDPQRGVLAHTEPSGQRIVSEKTALDMQGMLEKVVTDGTATSAKLEGYRAAGKTGTAQKIDATGRYSATKFIASFAGFAPASNPSIAMVVVVDEPVGQFYGGEVAAPIFKTIAEQILHYEKIPPDIQDYAPHYVAVPPRRQAPSAPIAKPVNSEDWRIVNAGLPGSQPANPPYESGEIVVPDFRGQSLRQFIEECKKLGLNFHADGSGRTAEQYPPAGAKVGLGTMVRIRLSSN